MYTDI
jgi:segregation and condensation protein B